MGNYWNRGGARIKEAALNFRDWQHSTVSKKCYLDSRGERGIPSFACPREDEMAGTEEVASDRDPQKMNQIGSLSANEACLREGGE